MQNKPEKHKGTSFFPFLSSHKHTTLLICFKVAKMDGTARGLTPALHTRGHTRSHVYLQWYVHQSMLAGVSVSVGQSQRVTHHLTLTLQFLLLSAAHRHNKHHIIFVSQLHFGDRQQNLFRITLDFFFSKKIYKYLEAAGKKKHHQFAKKD